MKLQRNKGFYTLWFSYTHHMPLLIKLWCLYIFRKKLLFNWKFIDAQYIFLQIRDRTIFIEWLIVFRVELDPIVTMIWKYLKVRLSIYFHACFSWWVWTNSSALGSKALKQNDVVRFDRSKYRVTNYIVNKINETKLSEKPPIIPIAIQLAMKYREITEFSEQFQKNSWISFDLFSYM